MENKYKVIKLFLLLLLFPLISAFDSSTFLSCGGDSETIIGCIGDNLNSFFGGDLISPVVSIISPADGYTISNYVSGSIPVSVNFSLIENNPNSCWYSTNSGLTNTSFSCLSGYNNFTFYLNSSGTFNLDLYASDFSGNEGSDSISVTLSIYTGPQTGGGSTIDSSDNDQEDLKQYNATILCSTVNSFLKDHKNYTYSEKEELRNTLAILLGFSISDELLNKYITNFDYYCAESPLNGTIPGEVPKTKKEINYTILFIILGAIIVLIIVLTVIYYNEKLMMIFVKNKRDKSQS